MWTMASQTTSSVFFLLVLVFSCLLSCESRRPPLHCSYDSIYQFGDSISDTGNLMRQTPATPSTALCSHLPYGQTSFEGTGRCSDGLLMIDFVARALQVPLLEPFLLLKGKDRYPTGLNFAVAGSTALPAEVLLQQHGVVAPVTNNSLPVQLQWFLDHIVNDIVNSKDDFGKSLFFVGEIGGNDYNYAFLQGKPISAVRDLVDPVVASIIDVVQALISAGAKQLVVPGNFPIGCAPSYLTRFNTDDPNAYDKSFCLKDLNEFAKYHNDQLKAALEDVRSNNPGVNIMYADYYAAFDALMKSVRTKTLSGDNMLKACCGTGGVYNFDVTSLCGTPGATVCKHPEQYISWDGIHGTQMAYEFMANWLLKDLKLQKKCV